MLMAYIIQKQVTKNFIYDMIKNIYFNPDIIFWIQVTKTKYNNI